MTTLDASAMADTALPGRDEPVEHLAVDIASSRQSRDREFTLFVEAHQQDLLRMAWLLCGDPHRAEELTQQALVRTYTAWPRARQRDPLAYARRALVNLRIDTWRRRRREVLAPPEDVTGAAERTQHDDGRAGSRLADRDELVRAFVTLSPRQRRVVVLRHLLDLPEAEVAAELGISVGTVKSTTSKALARLRAALAAPETGGTP